MALPGMECKLSLAPDHPDLKVTRNLGTPKQRRTYHVGGFSPRLTFAVYNNNINTLERAIKERVFYVKTKNDVGQVSFSAPPTPGKDAFLQLTDFKTQFRRLVVPTIPLTQKQFVAKYHGRKRTIYDNARLSLLSKPLTRIDSILKCFAKAEKYNFTANPDPVPRVIQPRNERYGISVGCYIKAVEKRTYGIIDTIFGTPTVMKGLNLTERGSVANDHWNSFRRPVVIGLDASRFDQHCSRDALLFEHSFYKMFFPRDDDLAKLLNWQIYNTGVGYCLDGKLKFKSIGGRKSGDQNTSLGNIILMCAMVYSFCKSISVNCKLMNDGDDCSLFIEREDLPKVISGISAYFLNLGYTLTVEEPVFLLEQVVFCQAQPVWVDGNYTMIRDPRVCMSKDCSILTTLPNKKVYHRWLSAVGAGGLSMTGGIPIWQDFYSTMLIAGQGAKPLNDLTMQTGMKIMGRGMTRSYKEVDPLTRVSFYYAFGICPDAQTAIESKLTSIELGEYGVHNEDLDLPLT